jgi:hypothetical protein
MILEIGKIYIVTCRTWDNSRLITARRKYLGEEKRFREIPCHVFSSRLTKRGYQSIISIPHYDLKDALEEVEK